MRGKSSYIMMLGMFISLLTGSHAFATSGEIDIELTSPVLYQGELSLFRIRVEKGQAPSVTWMGQDILLVHLSDEDIFTGFIFADLEQKPGDYIMNIRLMPAGPSKDISIGVKEKEYGVRRLALPKDKVDLSPENLERALMESAAMKSLWEAPDRLPEWSGPFIMPVDGEIISPFGRGSVINDQPKSPHSGVDIRGKTGTPVKATNNGTVVLTADHFFAGKSVVVDHGGGIRSMYFHLSKIMVRVGDNVAKGSVIGLVGSTGRSTGPHLHWGIRIKDARIDPVSLIENTRDLEE